MTETTTLGPTPDDILRAKLVLETASIHWSELQTHFAAGRLLAVAADLDLVDVAMGLAKDDKPKVEAWLRAGQLGSVEPPQAQAWYDKNQEFWAVVVAPWVLVQPRD